VYHDGVGTSTLISLEEYLRTSFHPDCDFIEGEVLERNSGLRRHSYAQAEIASWINGQKHVLKLQALTELRMQVAPGRIRIPDVVVCEIPMPEEEVFTTPPYLCVEVMSPDDTISAMQDRLDDYLNFRVLNVWVVDPWKHRGWRITAEGWAAESGVMRTADGRVALPLEEVLLP
jgi:Uma2 family endonuclease